MTYNRYPPPPAVGAGTVTQINTGTGLTGGPIVDTGTIGMLSGITTLTDAATIAWNAAPGFSFKVTLGDDRTLATPTNLISGALYTLNAIQDGTGSRLLSYATAGYQFASASPPTLSTQGGASDVLLFLSANNTLIFLSIVLRITPIPIAPSNFNAVGGVGQATLTWTDTSGGTESPQPQYFDGLDWAGVVAPLAPGTTMYVDTRAPGTYDYRVVGYLNGFVSAPSNVVPATIT